MTDDELRALIRAAIQRHAGSGSAEPASPRAALSEGRRDDRPAEPGSITFGMYRLDRPAGDTMCLIEPAVQCNHCGFCKCHGH